jgi:hypothetical protein
MGAGASAAQGQGRGGSGSGEAGGDVNAIAASGATKAGTSAALLLSLKSLKRPLGKISSVISAKPTSKAFDTIRKSAKSLKKFVGRDDGIPGPPPVDYEGWTYTELGLEIEEDEIDDPKEWKGREVQVADVDSEGKAIRDKGSQTTSKRVYYYHVELRCTSWKKPRCVALLEAELAREEQERGLMAGEMVASALIQKEEIKLNKMLKTALAKCRENIEVSRDLDSQRRSYIWPKARKIMFEYVRVQVVQERCRENLRTNPKDQTALCNLGYSLLRSQDHAEAVAVLSRASKNGKTTGKFWRLYAVAQLRHWEETCEGGSEGLEFVHQCFGRAVKYLENVCSKDVILGMLRTHVYFRSYDGAKSILSQVATDSVERLDSYQIDLHLCKATLSYLSNSFYVCIAHLKSLLNLLVTHATFESVNAGFAPSTEHLLFLIGFILKRTNQANQAFTHFFAAYTGTKERCFGVSGTTTTIHSLGLTHVEPQLQYTATDYGYWYSSWTTWKVGL